MGTEGESKERVKKESHVAGVEQIKQKINRHLSFGWWGEEMASEGAAVWEHIVIVLGSGKGMMPRLSVRLGSATSSFFISPLSFTFPQTLQFLGRREFFHTKWQTLGSSCLTVSSSKPCGLLLGSLQFLGGVTSLFSHWWTFSCKGHAQPHSHTGLLGQRGPDWAAGTEPISAYNGAQIKAPQEYTSTDMGKGSENYLYSSC